MKEHCANFAPQAKKIANCIGYIIEVPVSVCTVLHQIKWKRDGANS